MNKARQAINLMNEQIVGTPVKSADELKNGKTVMFKAGHPFEGLIARVINIHDDGSVDVKIGSSLRTAIKLSDLLVVPEVDLGVPGNG